MPFFRQLPGDGRISACVSIVPLRQVVSLLVYRDAMSTRTRRLGALAAFIVVAPLLTACLVPPQIQAADPLPTVEPSPTSTPTTPSTTPLPTPSDAPSTPPVAAPDQAQCQTTDAALASLVTHTTTIGGYFPAGGPYDWDSALAVYAQMEQELAALRTAITDPVLADRLTTLDEPMATISQVLNERDDAGVAFASIELATLPFSFAAAGVLDGCDLS